MKTEYRLEDLYNFEEIAVSNDLNNFKILDRNFINEIEFNIATIQGNVTNDPLIQFKTVFDNQIGTKAHDGSFIYEKEASHLIVKTVWYEAEPVMIFHAFVEHYHNAGYVSFYSKFITNKEKFVEMLQYLRSKQPISVYQHVCDSKQKLSSIWGSSIIENLIPNN